MPSVSEKRSTKSGLLRAKISLFSEPLNTAANRFWTHPRFAAVYRRYLFHSHSIIRATVPLLRAARKSCLEPRYASDPAMRRTAEYLERHAQEETGHDRWILDDAEVMGIRRASVLRRLPSPAAIEIVGAQYYWIHHYHPIAILGYIAVMEGTPSSTAFFEDVARRNHLPFEAISSFLYHARIDPKHKADLDRLIDSLPMKPSHMELIGLSAIQTIHNLTVMFEEINQSL